MKNFAEIKNKITDCYAWLMDKKCYDGNGEVPRSRKDELIAACNFSEPEAEVKVRYAVTVCRANLRNLPTAELWTDEPGYFFVDLLQGTAVDPGEALEVLHTSADGKMLFVEMRNYCGWIKAEEAALTSREEMLSYAAPEAFLVVTANQVRVAGELYQLGARLPLLRSEGEGGWVVQIPVRDEQGCLQSKEVCLPRSALFHQGWLECTRANLLRMAFTCLGDKYDWGGMTDSVDCSSFVADVYRTVGIELPRDADEQERLAPMRLNFSDGEAREKTLQRAEAGDLLFRDGHVMMYLGEREGVPSMIHAYARCRINGEVQAPRQVAVTKVDYTLADGRSNLAELTSIGKYIE